MSAKVFNLQHQEIIYPEPPSDIESEIIDFIGERAQKQVSLLVIVRDLLIHYKIEKNDRVL
jgi:hypothetical protein